MIILFHVGPTVVLDVGHLVTAVTHGQGCGGGGGGGGGGCLRPRHHIMYVLITPNEIVA